MNGSLSSATIQKLLDLKKSELTVGRGGGRHADGGGWEESGESGGMGGWETFFLFIRRPHSPNPTSPSHAQLDFVERATTISHNTSKTLDECFDLFHIIHSLVNTPEALAIVTRDVITEFWEDGVLYLELRTTPKK